MILRHLPGLLIATLLVGLGGCASPDFPSENTVVIPAENADSILVQVWFGTGSACDPEGKEGLAFLTAATLRGGAGDHSSSEINDRLLAMRASIDIHVDRDLTVIAGRCPKTAWPEFSELFLAAITEPVFDSVEMVKTRGVQLELLRQLRKNDAELVDATLQYYLYNNHRYGHPPQGTDQTVAGLTAEDAQAFYEQYYRSGNYTLGLAGAVSPAMAAAVNRALAAALPRGAAPLPELTVPEVKRLNIHLIEMDGTERTQLRFGVPVSAGYGEPDLAPLALINAHLGYPQDSGGLLFREFCAKRGLSEWAYSSIGSAEPDRFRRWPRRQQYFAIGIRPIAENVNFVIRGILREFKALADSGLSEVVLDSLRKAVNTHLTPRTLSEQLEIQMDRSVSQWSAIDSLRAAVNRTTTEDIRRVATRVLGSNNMVIVATVPNGEAFVNELLGKPIGCTYPEGIDTHRLRRQDHAYMSFFPPFDPRRIRIINAEELFR